MASSYVEVRDSENGTGDILPFEIDTNGLDLPTHIENDPPKDHTYNKDPEVFEVVGSEPSDKEGDNTTPVRKSNRGTKGSRSKAGKKEEPPKPAPKKIGRKKASPVKEAVVEVAEENEVVNEEKPDETETKVEEDAVTPETTAKRGRKRKANSDIISEVVEKQGKLKKENPPIKESDEKATEKEVQEEKLEEDEEESQDDDNLENKEIQKENKPSKQRKKPIKQVKKKAVPKKKLPLVSKSPEKTKAAPNRKKSLDAGNVDPSLPTGWTRKVVERKSGKTAGHIDIYIYSPEGLKFRSRPDIAAYLNRTKSKLKLEDFNFTKKGIQDSGVEVVPARVRGAKEPEPKVAKKVPVKSKKPAVNNNSSKKEQKLVVKLSTPKKGDKTKRGSTGGTSSAQKTSNRRKK